jgi:nucleotide-binding universal stress UspA family protein
LYKRVLAAVNEFTNSEVAATYAVTFTRVCGGKLTLYYADEGKGKEAASHAEAALERLFKHSVDEGIDIERVVEKGAPLDKIPQRVAADGIDIVFIASRREDVSKRFFIKTLPRELMLALPCSVALARVVKFVKPAPRHILAPVRGFLSDLDKRAFFLAALARGYGSKLTLFYMQKQLMSFFHGETHLGPAQREERLPKDIRQYITAVEALGVTPLVRTAHDAGPWSVVTESALHRNDLIVMGASQRGLLRTLISGNPVEEALRETICNMLIFKP